MQKITELLNALGNCLCGAAKLFSEYNTYREISEKQKNLPQKRIQTDSDKKKN